MSINLSLKTMNRQEFGLRGDDDYCQIIIIMIIVFIAFGS